MSPGFVDVIAEVLAEKGPMTEDQLAAALASRGVDLGDDPDEVLDEALDDSDGLVTVLADERWASLPALLAGRVFTHRLSGLELEHDILVMNSDLKPVDMLTECEEYQRLADGSPVVGVLMPFDADTVAARGSHWMRLVIRVPCCSRLAVCGERGSARVMSLRSVSPRPGCRWSPSWRRW